MRGVIGRFANFAALFFLVHFIVACAGSSGSTNRNNESDAGPLTSGGGNGFDMTDSLGDVADSLKDVPAENAQQQAALDDTAEGLGDLADVYGLLGSVDTRAEAQQWVQRLAAAENALKALADRLQQVGLAQIAAVLREILAKHDVYRAYTKKTGQHHLFTDLVEGIALVASGQWVFEGVSLRMYDNNASGRRPVYRCFIPQTGGHFTSILANCEGYTLEGILGYVRTARANDAYLPLIRFGRIKGLLNHVTTFDPNEQAFIRKDSSYREDGIIGYMNP